MKKNFNEVMFSFIFVFIGSLFFVMGVVMCFFTFNQDGKIDTTGVITRIDSYRDSDGDIDYDVYVSYEVNGREYVSQLNSYSSSFAEGKEIDIYYLDSDPKRIGNSTMDLMVLIAPGMGLIFIIIGLSSVFRKNKNKRLLKRLKSKGDLIYAEVMEVSTNTNYSVNGRNPFVIKCEWMSPYDGKKYIFKSQNLWEDPTDIIEERSIKQFPVYITRERVKPYVMDLEILNDNNTF